MAPAAAAAARTLQGLSEERQLWRSGVRVNLLGTRVTAPKRKAE
jgi:hypothetical protein